VAQQGQNVAKLGHLWRVLGNSLLREKAARRIYPWLCPLRVTILWFMQRWHGQFRSMGLDVTLKSRQNCDVNFLMRGMSPICFASPLMDCLGSHPCRSLKLC